MKTEAIVIFLLTYIMLLIFPKIRAYIALSAATLFVVIGILPVSEALPAIDWNVILMIAGTMGVVALFIESKMPALLADKIIEKTPNIKWAIIALSLFAGIISAFVDNVATVLMVAPVALTIAKKLGISPVKSIIAIAISSNLQGAATLVGDTTSVIMGGHANMNFLDFFFFKGRIGMFWVVQAGAMAATLLLFFIFRKEKQPISSLEKTVVKDYFPSVLLLGIVVLLIIASFIPETLKPYETNGIICVTLFVIGLIRKFIITKDKTVFSTYLKEIDYTTILLLIGLFVLIAGIGENGVDIVGDIGDKFRESGIKNPFLIFSIIVWGSVLLSAFIDNIPYVATMLPVVDAIAAPLGVNPFLLYFGLLTGATLGGNLTPIGASANITAMGILRKDGHVVSAGQFMKISIPFTLTAVSVGYLMIWFLWK